MKITDNQKAIAAAIGLEIKENPYKPGDFSFVKPSGTIPQGTDIMDTYYPNLYTRIISQAVSDSLRGSQLLTSLISREDWLNGWKEEFYTGIYDLNDYSKAIVIGDFNPKDETMYQNKYYIDYEKYTAKKLDRLGIIAAFTNPGTLENFVEREILRHKQTIENFIQNEQGKILSVATDASIPMVYDEIIDIDGTLPEDVMEDVNARIMSYTTSSSNHLALTDKTVKYSAKPENLVMVWDNKYKALIDKSINAKLYHPSVLNPKLSNEIISFVDLEDTADTLNYIAFGLYDKQAIKKGVKIEDLYWEIKAPKGQTVQELHNQFGYAILPNFIKVGYYDSSKIVPPAKTMIKKIEELNKKAPKIKYVYEDKSGKKITEEKPLYVIKHTKLKDKILKKEEVAE